MSKLLIWDLDDTLVDNVHDYSEPLLDACRLIIRTLGSAAPHASVIMAMEHEVDTKRVKEINPATGKPFGYTMERFPGSLVVVYEQICAKAGRPVEESVCSDLYRIGMMAFDKGRYKDNIKPGALHLLQQARDHGHRNVLLTKGDPRVQRVKVEALREVAKDDLFRETRIVETNKDPEVFLELAETHSDHQDAAVYAIGNDYKKDVLPALNAHPSFRGIWIPAATWELTVAQIEETYLEIDHKRCAMLGRLEQIEELLLS